MRYKHVKSDQFYQGLPTGEIDDATLDTEQQMILGAAVAAGVYEPISPVSVKKSKKDDSDDQPSSKA